MSYETRDRRWAAVCDYCDEEDDASVVLAAEGEPRTQLMYEIIRLGWTVIDGSMTLRCTRCIRRRPYIDFDDDGNPLFDL